MSCPRGTAEFWLGLCDVRLCHFSLIRPHDEASGSDIGERDHFGRTSHAWRRDSRLCPLSGLPLARHHFIVRHRKNRMSKPESKAKKKCGLVMPISAIDGCTETHWEQVRTIIEEALEGTELSVELVSDADDVGVIQKRIIQNLYDNDIVVCDVSCKNPNVMFELGMRLAFDKPAVIIKDDVTTYSFDTSPVEHLTYPRGLHYHLIQDFKKKLRSKVLATLEASKKPDYTTFLKHFGKFVVANLEEKELGKDEFILESLSDLRHELRRMRMEQHEIMMRPPQIQRRPVAEPVPNVEDVVIEFLHRREIGPEGVKALKDPSSNLFRELHSEYMDKVVARVVNPKPRHEHMAERELIATLEKFLP